MIFYSWRERIAIRGAAEDFLFYNYMLVIGRYSDDSGVIWCDWESRWLES